MTIMLLFHYFCVHALLTQQTVFLAVRFRTGMGDSVVVVDGAAEIEAVYERILKHFSLYFLIQNNMPI